MKRTVCIWTVLLLLLPVKAQDRLVERVYVTTDRPAYVTGDLLWCSVFCVDATEGKPSLSDFSSIAYLELVSSEGSELTAKIALIGGRGGGVIRIPQSLPTGNYRLIAYTAQNRNEQSSAFTGWGRTISVFNTLSTRRVKGGVKILPPGEYASRTRETAETGSLALRINRHARPGMTVPLILDNTGGPAATVSVSVSLEDGIAAPENGNVAAFLDRLPPKGSVTFTERTIPEYEGEILFGKVAGADREKVPYNQTQFAVISSAGAASDTYVSQVRDGEAVFFTNNIYGDRELVCELLGFDPSLECFLHIDSPFLRPQVGDIPPLVLSQDLREALRGRQAAMQAMQTAVLDTLAERLPRRENLLLNTGDARVYHLDDYVRFPTVQEVLVEIVPELRIRKGKTTREREIQMLYTDRTGSLSYYMGDILVLLDGVVVSDHARILSYDALLFEDICIYSFPYTIGPKFYRGIVNFKTKKNGSIALKFTDHTRVFDFQGASLPVAFTGKTLPESDLRQTLYWHPLIEVGAGEEKMLDIRTPGYSGVFRVVVEGLDAEGRPVFSERILEVL